MGVDGWWPDEGDWLDVPARLARNRMYWEGPQDRPPVVTDPSLSTEMERLECSGTLRFFGRATCIRAGQTLETHQVPIGINTRPQRHPLLGDRHRRVRANFRVHSGAVSAVVPVRRVLSAVPVPWPELDSAAASQGWNTGESGPQEVRSYRGSGLPDASELHNAAVEPICRKYLELRYRLMPYLYSAVHEATKTGLPVMRALWLHYPHDLKAVAFGDAYLWGRDILVAPVFEKGANSRSVYLPEGTWYDFWTQERLEGGARSLVRSIWRRCLFS